MEKKKFFLKPTSTSVVCSFYDISNGQSEIILQKDTLEIQINSEKFGKSKQFKLSAFFKGSKDNAFSLSYCQEYAFLIINFFQKYGSVEKIKLNNCFLFNLSKKDEKGRILDQNVYNDIIDYCMKSDIIF